MRAMVLRGPGRVELSQVEAPDPGPGELLLAPLTVGICHSDVHIRRTAGNGRVAPGTVLGHEICARVLEAGPGTDQRLVGHQVVVHPVWGCGSCRSCRAGRPNACLTGPRLGAPRTPGVTAPGGLAERMVVPASAVLAADGLDPLLACTLTDAVLVPYGAIAAVRGEIVPGAVVVVIGVGGLGLMAVQLLRATSAVAVIAVDPRPTALATATSLAHPGSQTDAAAVEQILRITGPAGAAVVLDFVGSAGTLELACDVVAPFGAIQVVGMADGAVTLTSGSASRLPRGARITPRWFNGGMTELAEVVELARAGAVQPVLQPFDFHDAVAALDALEAGEIVGRAVVKIG